MTNKDIMFLKRCVSIWGNVGMFNDLDNNSLQKVINLSRDAIRSYLNGELIDGLSLEEIKTLLYIEGFCNYLDGYKSAKQIYS